MDESIFKSYDIRGIYPQQLNEDIAYKLGRALVEYLRPQTVAVGRDVRLSSESLACATIKGITEEGAEVIDIGLCSTDGLYFAVGNFKYDGGVMITASHNPPEYNGMKVCKKDAVPLSGQEGLDKIKELVLGNSFPTVKKTGKITRRDIDQDYTSHTLSFVDKGELKPFKIVIDAGNGIAGKIVPQVFRELPCKVIPLFFDLDGTFPNHLPNPIVPENTVSLRDEILKQKADLGAIFDGDADRMFLMDEKGKLLGGDMVTALVAKNLLKKEKGATILYNLVCSKTVPEIIQKSGGKGIRTRVGHALIKPLMKKYNAIFGGEHSGHFYFRNNWFADSGLIALLVCLELISEENKPLSTLLASIDHYFRSGEINSQVADIPGKLKEVEKRYAGSGKIDRLDGLTIEFDTWWFSLRASNTEPLLRLNIEATSEELLGQKKKEMLELIRS
ncbi:MAG TPA: phosphomannomutase/phosphoglucomutase [candidate division Zixibacteria bacterium]